MPRTADFFFRQSKLSPRKWTTFFGLAVISKKDKRRAGRKISVSRDFVAWVSRENDKLEDNDARGIINQAAD